MRIICEDVMAERRVEPGRGSRVRNGRKAKGREGKVGEERGGLARTDFGVL